MEEKLKIGKFFWTALIKIEKQKSYTHTYGMNEAVSLKQWLQCVSLNFSSRREENGSSVASTSPGFTASFAWNKVMLLRQNCYHSVITSRNLPDSADDVTDTCSDSNTLHI